MRHVRNKTTQTNMVLTFSLGTLFFCFCQVALANTTQSLDALKSMVENYIDEKTQDIDGEVSFRVTPLDHRLRLSDCGANLSVFLPAGRQLEGHSTIGVKCTNPAKYWTVFLSAKIEIYRQVVVTTRPIERGKIISASDLTTKRQEVSTLRASYYVNPEHVVGKVAARRMALGVPVSSAAIFSPPLVKRGEQVTIIATLNTLEIRMSGQALANGKEGDVIKVKNINSNRVIEGRVSKAGTVQVRI